MNTKDRWILAIKANELHDGEKKALLLEGNKILLLNSENRFFAISNVCPHMECPLSKGVVEEYLIKCPCHDWKFDIRSGEFTDAREIQLPVYETKIVDGNIFVNMEGAGI